MQELLDALERRRAALGWSQAEMARRLGVSDAHYSLVLSGGRRPEFVFLAAVAAAFPDLHPDVVRYLQAAGEVRQA